MVQFSSRVHCAALTTNQMERALLRWVKTLSFSQMDIAPLCLTLHSLMKKNHQDGMRSRESLKNGSLKL